MPNSSVLRRPLDMVFRAPSHIAILRALRDDEATSVSGRAVARIAGVNHQACAVALRRLERMGLVERRGAGKAQLVHLNSEHFIVRDMLQPLLRRERDAAGDIRRAVAERFESRALAGLLAADPLAAEDRPAAVELLLVAEPDSRAALAAEARRFGAAFRKRFGVRLRTFVLTPSEARERLALDPALQRLRKRGRDVLSRRVGKILNS